MNAKKLMTLTAVFCVAAAMPSMAANWKGNGADTLWSTAANWDSVPANNSSASLAFREANPPNKTATLDAAYSYTGNIHVGQGSSAANPYIWEATDPSYGLTIGDDTWLGYHEDGWLWLKSGTYTFTTKSNKALHLGQGPSGATHNFWMKVGDGSSTASLTSKSNHSYIRGGSALVADKATITFSPKNLYMYNTSAVYLTNSTMTAAYIYLEGTPSMTLSNSTLTFSGDFNIPNSSGGNCVLRSVSGTLNHTGSGTVFNVGIGANSTGIVEKVGGDWSCYYLRLGNGSGATGTFTMDGGTLTLRTELGIGRGANSTGTFTLNGGTVKAKRVLVNSTATSTLVINGGTFQANGTSGAWIDSPVDIRIGANGGTIHTDGGNVVIAPAVGNVENTSGGLTVTGGGTAAFSSGGNFAGTLSVGEDTTLRWFDSDAAVANYTVGSLSLDAGSTLYLDADATGCDTINASASVTATAAKKATIKLIVRAMPESGRVFPLLTMSEADAANCNVVAETPAGASLVVEKGWANGQLTYAIFAKDYVWNDGTNGGGWTDGAKWGVDGVASEWQDNNNAVFANAGDVATLDANVTVVALDFQADATVNGAEGVEAAITVPEVAVASGVTATLNAPISGTFAKIGAGTLALGTNRMEQTTLTEGTLAVVGTASLDWTKLTFGTDAAKPVTLRVGPEATLENRPATWTIGTVANITSTVVNASGDRTIHNLYMANAAGAYTSFIHEGGTLTLESTSDFGKNNSAAHAYFEIAGGMVTNTAGYIHSGANCPATITVKTGGKYGMSAQDTYGLIVSGGHSGTLNVKGGDVFVNGPLNLCYRGGSAVVNVTDGGMLTLKKILLNGGSSGGTATITLDGGIMRAYENNTAFIPNKNNLTLAAGSNGGTLDVNGKAITVARPIGGTGGMAFTGGGTVTFTTANTYAGTTTVEVGTKVIVTVPSAIGSGLVVTAPETAPADGVYTLLAITGEGTFAASVLSGVAAPTGSRLILSGDAKSVLCIYGDPGFIWIGGASGNLSEASNWANGTVPTSGDDCVIGSPIAANLTVGDTFSPSTITFPADTALVTISGARALSGLSSVTNNSLQHHVFACEVDASAATPTLPLLDANYLVFSGGIALSAMPSVNEMRLAGVWNLDGNWNEPPTGASIMSGSTVNVTGKLDNGYNLVINNEATLRVANAVAPHGASPQNRFLYKNDGSFIITGDMKDTIQSADGTAYSLAGVFAKGNANAVTRANGLVHSGSTKDAHQFRLNNSGDSVTNTIVLGSGGLSFFDNLRSNTSCYPYFQIDNGKCAILASSADWSFGANPVSGKDLNIELEGTGTLIVDTSDYDNPTVGHTIRAIGRIGGGGILVVKGCGKLVLERYADFARGLTIQDTATLAIKSGCTPTRSAPTVEAGATLQVAQSGTATLSQDLTLRDNACLGFNFTSKTVPVLDVTGRTVTFGGQSNVVVKVSAAEGIRAKGGANVLTSGGKFANANVSLAEGYPKWVKGVSVVDGEIVLDVKARETFIIVK